MPRSPSSRRTRELFAAMLAAGVAAVLLAGIRVDAARVAVRGSITAFGHAGHLAIDIGGNGHARIVAGIADRGVTRLASGRKTDGGFALAAFVDVECVTLPGFETPKPFKF